MKPLIIAGAQSGWRGSTLADIDAICAIERQVHPSLQERREVHAEKIAFFGEGCCVCVAGAEAVGYAVSYPWRLDDIPTLDTLFAAFPDEPDCLFIHDVALLPQARGRGAAKAFVEHAISVARARHLAQLALVSVYGTGPLWSRLGFSGVEAPGGDEKLRGRYGETARYMRRAVS